MERQLLKKTILKKIKNLKILIESCEDGDYKKRLQQRLNDLEEINQICVERNRY